MDETKLSESIELFKQYYLHDRKYYEEDERVWKVELASQFQRVFVEDGITSDLFLESLRSLFEDPKARQLIVLLSGGSFYQHQRFLDLLLSRPDRALLSELFHGLLFSRATVRNRINNFKSEVDALYRGLSRRGTIQLNLISQFLGLCFPNEHYIYKNTEFRKTAAYFEYGGGPSDTSAGGIYEYFHRFAREIKAAMNEAGLHDVDFIDVQTFVFRRDWHSPTDLERENAKFDEETAKAESLSLEELADRVKRARSVPPKVVRGIYYYRDPNVAALVKKDAQGMCNLCSGEAPFKNRAGKPYLECHHIKHLADGGRDEIANCAALCPNCHARMHVLNLESDRRKLLTTAQERYERLLM